MTTPHESALLAAAEAMRDVEIGYSINLTRLVDGVAEHTATLPDGSTHVFPTSAASSEFVERERNLAKAKAAVEAYLAGMGGILCHPEPTAWYAEDSLGCEYLTLETRQAEQWRATYEVFGLHMPLSIAGKGDDGWADISSAPKGGTFILIFAPDLDRRALVSWQGRDDEAQWYGIDDMGLTFASRQQKDEPTHWRPLPTPPSIPSDEGSEKP